jgi:hypothetical protein
MAAGIVDYALDKYGKSNLKVVAGNAILGVSQLSKSHHRIDLPIAHPVVHICF